MLRELSKPIADAADVTLSIAKGGTGAYTPDQACVNLHLLNEEQINVPLGIGGLDENGKYPLGLMPSNVNIDTSNISGPSRLTKGSKGVYQITDYSSDRTYIVSATSGSAHMNVDKIEYTAPNEIGTFGFTFNGRNVSVEVAENIISKPTITSPTQDAVDRSAFLNVSSNSFSIKDGYVEEILTASDKATNDYFGVSVSLTADGTRMAIGAYGKDVSGITIAGQVYIYTRSGSVWTEEATITASDKAANDYFGASVSLTSDGTRLAVGAYNKTVSGITGAGKVYIYTRSGSTWVEEATITASDKVASDYFGISVALTADGSRMVVGAFNKIVSGITAAGKVYVYTRSGSVWTEEATITASDKAVSDWFGASVSLIADGTKMAVGAHGKDVSGITDAGKIYIYTRSGTVWVEESTITASDKAIDDYFGVSVSLTADGTRLAVGAYNKTVSGITGAGKVYIYTRSGSTWVEEATVTASDKAIDDYFGVSVALTADGTRLAVGASGKENGAIDNSGAVYLYDISLHTSTDWQLSDTPDFSNILQESLVDTVNLTSWYGTDLQVSKDYYIRCRYNGSLYGTSEWSDFKHFTTKAQFLPTTELTILTASDKAVNNYFGVSVALTADGTRMAIGSTGKDISGISDAGQVYIYTRTGSVWTEEATITASDKAASNLFGTSVALDSTGTRMAIGSTGKDISGISDAGQVYIYTRTGSVWTEEATITASDKAVSDQFGRSVSLSSDGTRLAIGAQGKTVSGITVAGKVYVYTRSGSVWTEEATITASDKAASDLFGTSVALDSTGTRMAIGAYGKDVSGIIDAGKVYIYTRSGSVWTEEATITASDKEASDLFGTSVALTADGTKLIVGAIGKDISGISDAGKVYIYTRSGTTWIETVTLSASDKAINNYFGMTSALTSNESLLAIGSYGRDSEGIANSGAVYIFY